MLSFEDAQKRCQAIPAPQVETLIPLTESIGKVLYRDVYANYPSPRWDNSAMDGYAISYSDHLSVGMTFDVIESIPAGKAPSQMIQAKSCARIMTGAPMPNGADTVIIQENVERVEENKIRILKVPNKGQNVRLAGEEMKKGDRYGSKGQTINSGLIGVFATQNLIHIPVYKPPKIGIIATGDEIKSSQTPLKKGQIWSSNTPALFSAIHQVGGLPVDCGIANDTVQSVKLAYSKALNSDCDLIISTGGVSVGDFDVVKDAMASVGANMNFWKVRMKPGKPLAVGQIGTVPIFGLPGNPVSCLVSFCQFVKPWIMKALGYENWKPTVFNAEMTEPFAKRHGRTEFVRVIIWKEDSGWKCKPTGNQSSAWLGSMAQANGLLKVPMNKAGVEAGQVVSIELLD